MSIAAKPFKFLNEQTNLPTSEFQNVSNNGILNQVYSEGSSLLNGITSAITSGINAATSLAGGIVNDISSGIGTVENTIGSIANDAASVVSNAVSGIESSVTGIASDIGNTVSSATAVGTSAITSGNPLSAVGNLIPTSLTTNISNSLNSGSVFNTGTNLASNTMLGIVASPAQQVIDQGTTLISNLGRNIYNGVNSLSSTCINQLLNDLNQYCNLNVPNLNLGLNGGGGCNPQAVAGILNDLVGGGAGLGVPDLCSAYRQLTGFTMLGAQNGITGVFSPLAATINNQTVTNKAGINLFNYSVGKSNLNLLQDLGNSSAVNAISTAIPNCSSLISQCVLTPASDISTSISDLASTFTGVQTNFNSNYLTGSQNGVSIPNISNLMQNVPPSNTIINATMSSIISPISTINHVSATNVTLPGSSNNLNTNNNSYNNNLLAVSSVLGGSNANLPTSSNTTSSSSTTVGVNNSTYAQEVSAANSVLGGSNTSTTPDGYTTVSASTSSATTTTTSAASTASTLVVNNTASNSSAFSTTGSYNNNPYQSSMQAVSDVFGNNSSNNTSQNNLNIDAVNSVTGSNSSSGSSSSTVLVTSSSYNDSYQSNMQSASNVLGSSTGSSSNSNSLIGTVTNAAMQTFKYQSYNNSVSISDVIANPTQASSGTNITSTQQAYLALKAAQNIGI